MHLHKKIKIFSVTLLVLFVGLNVISAFHAYKFTHYIENMPVQKTEIDSSWLHKMNSIVFGVDLPRPQDSIYPDRPYSTLNLKSNKEIECWSVLQDTMSLAKGTVILCHGYGGCKSSMLVKSKPFLDEGYDVFLFDFMGSGGSEGNQTTIGYFESKQVKTVFDYLTAKGETNIILFGTSMGAAAVMKAQHDYNLPAEAFILECPYKSMRRTVQNRFKLMGLPTFPADLLVFWGGVINRFNAFGLKPVDYAKSITAPVLLIYGKADIKVHQDETDAIFAAIASSSKQLKEYPLAGHDDYLNKYSEEWTADIKAFLNDLEADRVKNVEDF